MSKLFKVLVAASEDLTSAQIQAMVEQLPGIGAATAISGWSDEDHHDHYARPENRRIVGPGRKRKERE